MKPNLKSASGAGFSFEDKVTAYLMCEMLLAAQSEGYGILLRLERQATDWEPFGDLLLTFQGIGNVEFTCACSVKSNRAITGKGCGAELREALWSVLDDHLFDKNSNLIGLFTAPLSETASDVINQLVVRAREETNPIRFEEKTLDNKHLIILNSLKHPLRNDESGHAWHVFSRLIPREFDFERAHSQRISEAISMCLNILKESSANQAEAGSLWESLLVVAQSLRDSGGSVTRETLTEKLRSSFELKNDPDDNREWVIIDQFSEEWMSEISVELPGHIHMQREDIISETHSILAGEDGVHILGESGCGKSAAAKLYADRISSSAGSVVWIRAEGIKHLRDKVPNLNRVLARTRQSSALLVIDALDSCYDVSSFVFIGQLLSYLAESHKSQWKVILTCQDLHWDRVFIAIRKHTTHAALQKQVRCGELSDQDFSLVCEKSPSINRLRSQGHLDNLLGSPKMIDVLLSGKELEQASIAGEADLAQWWWNEKVRGTSSVAREETLAKKLSVIMADELVTEIGLDALTDFESIADNLIERNVLRRTKGNRVRFHHDLFADWSRVMVLREKQDHILPFILSKVNNPPWMRAIRLYSQHLLEREADIQLWKSLIANCILSKNNKGEIPSDMINIIDGLVEAIPFCSNVKHLFVELEDDLLRDRCFLLKRMLGRLLQMGTFSDPVMVTHISEHDSSLVENAGRLYRLPRVSLWHSSIDFLELHSKDVVEYLSREVAEIALMWSRLEAYTGIQWGRLANLAILNAECLLRKEMDGYRVKHEKGDSKIYEAALRAASQEPDHVRRLILKASGRIAWDDIDISPNAERGWLGEWRDRSYMGYYGRFVPTPPEAWQDGPSRTISEGFEKSWFQGDASLALYRRFPEAAREATLAFLIDWPKAIIDRQFFDHSSDRHGFNHEANEIAPVFWTTGPFINFLRGNWLVGLDLIIRLVNFATDRYEEWWPYEPIQCLNIGIGDRNVKWKGNGQVYAWNLFYMNTAHVVTCALMALERWFDEELKKENNTVAAAIRMIYENGNSLAFAGILISIGKRHPVLFLNELKPLLFCWDLFPLDQSAILSNRGVMFGFREDEWLFNLRQEWNNLPGRQVGLQDCGIRWLLVNEDFRKVFDEVASAWRSSALRLPNDSFERKAMLRWASSVDGSHYRVVELQGGVQAWQQQLPDELRDIEAEENLSNRQALLTLPYRCSEFLEKRETLDDSELNGIWEQLHEWKSLEEASRLLSEGNESNGDMWDHRHSRAALLAVLLRFGDSWMETIPDRRVWIEEQVRQLLMYPPQVTINSPDDIHEDFESYLARCVIQCWAHEPERLEWHMALIEFVTAIRYRTVAIVFDEAFKLRSKLGKWFGELECLALSFAASRAHYQHESKIHPKPEILKTWHSEWKQKFLSHQMPGFIDDWSQLAYQPPLSMWDRSYKRNSRSAYTNLYGFDIKLLLAAFTRPALSEAGSDQERSIWLHHTTELLRCYIRTLPLDELSQMDDWDNSFGSRDEAIFRIVSNRLYECSSEEQEPLWKPILDLPIAAREPITDFLRSILLASESEPTRVQRLIPLWLRMASHLEHSHHARQSRTYREILQTFLLYGTRFAKFNTEEFTPLVEALRPLYRDHIKSLPADASAQSQLALFLVSKAGEPLLIDALEALQETWNSANITFWQEVNQRSRFSELLECSHKRFEEIRNNEGALRGYKLLTKNLAALHDPMALEIQHGMVG